MRARAYFVGIALSVAVSGAHAQTIDSVAGEWHLYPALGLRFGTPQKASVALGFVVGKNYRERGHTQDLAVYAEPGISAGRATVAYVSGMGNMGQGLGIGATALRTWKDPLTLRTNRTYAGAEAWLWPGFFLGPRVGVFREMTGTRHGWYASADIGFGL